MPEFRLSPAADADLDRLYDFGIDRFGLDQADRYYDGLEQRFAALAQFPLHYPAVDYVRQGYRRSVYGAHSIYYRILNGDCIEIMRIIGQEDF